MNSQTKYIKYGFIILAIICSAIFTGKYLSKAPIIIQASNVVTNDATKITEEKEKLRAFEKADYIASPPTFGPLIQTQFIQVEFQNDLATGFLTIDAAKKINTKQDVILFDKENYVLPLGGSIANIEDSDSTQKKITIALPKGTNTEFLSNTVSIITLETVASKRLPLGALQQDKNKKDFVWIANADSEKHNKVQKLYIDVGLMDEEYFEENGHKIESFTPVIINPDNKIKSDKKYNIVTTELEGPIHNPIHQAWVDYELARLDAQQKDLEQVAADCASGKTALVLKPGALTLADGTQTGSGCGQTGYTPPDPVQIFNALINNNGQAGCSSSAACGQ